MSARGFWRDPFEAARARAKRPWAGRVPADRGALGDRVFPEHVIHACLAWAHRLRLERRGERALKRPARTIRACANRWPRAAEQLRKTQGTRRSRGDEVDHHHSGEDAESRRLWVAAGFSAAAVFAFLAIEFGFARSALDLFLEEPEQLFLGYKIEDIGAVAIALTMAAAAEIAARSIRGFLGVLSSRLRRLLIIVGALLLPVAFILPFLALREEAAELGGSGPVSSQLPGLAQKAVDAGGGDPTIPFLVLGLAPVLVGAVLRAASSSPRADDAIRLRLRYATVWSQLWVQEWRFSRLVRRLDRAELRIGRRLRAIARREAGDEAGRIVDRIGYRFAGDRWYGWLERVPGVVDAMVHERPGLLPGGSQGSIRERFEVTTEALTEGGPVRQRLEADFGNPVVPEKRGQVPPLQMTRVVRAGSNNHKSATAAKD
ncbi:MAG: hypothetical protein ACOYD4_11835 [Solirubrobacterales bacterium]